MHYTMRPISMNYLFFWKISSFKCILQQLLVANDDKFVFRKKSILSLQLAWYIIHFGLCKAVIEPMILGSFWRKVSTPLLVMYLRHLYRNYSWEMYVCMNELCIIFWIYTIIYEANANILCTIVSLYSVKISVDNKI